MNAFEARTEGRLGVGDELYRQGRESMDCVTTICRLAVAASVALVVDLTSLAPTALALCRLKSIRRHKATGVQSWCSEGEAYEGAFGSFAKSPVR